MHITLLLLFTLVTAEDELFAPREFDSLIMADYVADTTSKNRLEEFHYSMFRAITFIPSGKVLNLERRRNGTFQYENIEFLSVERMNIMENPGLSFTTGSYSTWNGSEITRLNGFANSSEDPRISVVGDRAIVSFTIKTGVTHHENKGFFQRWMAVSYFDSFNIVLLKIPGVQNFLEKNWAPFSKNGELLFVYSFDPLIILNCNPENAECKIIYKDAGVSFPIDTRKSHLRGGTNLVPVSETDDRYYIGGCHTFFHWKDIFHFYVVVVLDTVEWKIIHVSKPVRFKYDGQLVGWGSHIQLGRVGNTLADMYVDHLGMKFFIQDPISLMRVANNTFLTTVNVRDCVSLLYELRIPLDDIILENGKEPRKPLGYWNQRAHEMTDWLGDHFKQALQKKHNLAGVRGSHTADGQPIPSWRFNYC